MMLGIIMGSCKKYLDVKFNNGQRFAETAEDCQLLLDNYAIMNVGYPYDGELSADDIQLSTDSYNRLNNPEDRDLYIWSANARRGGATPQWKNPYAVVFQANLVLETVQKLQTASTDPVTLNTLKGSALFYKAYAFWHVAQLYAKPYSVATAGQDLGIPLKSSLDINDISVRSTVQQTYDKIVQDLQEAVNLLPATSSIVTRPNKAAAYAMLARTWLSMEKYPEALTAANAALEINGLSEKLLNYSDIEGGSLSPFYPRFNREVIFHSVTNSSPALDPHPTKTLIDAGLVASYNDNDLRKSLFFRTFGGGNYFFTGNYEGSILKSDFFNGLAVDELYLIRSECYARANQITEAMRDLNDLLRTRFDVVRDLNGSPVKDANGNTISTFVDYTASTADEALDIILKERRKELVMRGQRWTDLRRLNRDSRFAKTLQRNLDKVYELPPNDPRYVLLIPEEVIKNAGIPQNQR